MEAEADSEPQNVVNVMETAEVEDHERSAKKKKKKSKKKKDKTLKKRVKAMREKQKTAKQYEFFNDNTDAEKNIKGYLDAKLLDSPRRATEGTATKTEPEQESDDEDLLDTLNETLRRASIFCFLEDKTGVHASDFFFLAITSVLLVLFLVVGLRSLLNIVAFFYPAYQTFKSLDERDNFDQLVKMNEENKANIERKAGAVDMDDEYLLLDKDIDLNALDFQTQLGLHYCLQYWTVFSTFLLVEFMCDFIVSWVPNYENMKLVLLVWLILPRADPDKAGSSVFYANVVQPLLTSYEKDMDDTISKVGSFVEEVWEEVLGLWSDTLMNKFGSLFSMLSGAVAAKAAGMKDAGAGKTEEPQAQPLKKKVE